MEQHKPQRLVPFWWPHSLIRRNTSLVAFATGWIIIAEGVISFGNVVLGLLLHALLVPLLLSYYVLREHTPERRLLLVLVLAPLLRILSLSMPLSQLSHSTWYAFISTPLFIAALLTARVLNLSPAQLGFGPIPWRPQLAIGFTGVPLGLAAFLMLQPEPLMDQVDVWLLIYSAVSILVFSGFVEELIFRGLIQHVAREIYGRAAMLYSSFVFSIMFLGTRSLSAWLVATLLGLCWGWSTERSGSLWGVSAAHSITNVGILLVYPLLFARLSGATAPSIALIIFGLLLMLSGLISSLLIYRWLRHPHHVPVPLAPSQVPATAGYVAAHAAIAARRQLRQETHGQLCSVKEAALRLGVSESTIRRRIQSGVLVAQFDGRRWHVTLPQLEPPPVDTQHNVYLVDPPPDNA